ncbi:MAG: 50S ribosomal protein L19 [Spirochaetia bacterium]|nr:50S ribosomal protein L19 [Spirochaetia bacterium]
MEKLHLEQVSKPLNINVGDLVKVHYRIKEGNKERIQIYEGTVIAIRNHGAGKSIVVRRVSYDVGVERIFPVYSPTVEKIEKMRSSKVRRSKLYYQRELSGKKSRLTEIKKSMKADAVFDKAETKRKTAESKKPKAAEPAAEVEAAPEQA